MGYLFLSFSVFCIGIVGLLIRRNLIVILMSLELMLSAVNIALVHFSNARGALDGEAAALFVLVVAACETAIGLAIIVTAVKRFGTADISKMKELKY